MRAEFEFFLRIDEVGEWLLSAMGEGIAEEE
jgi:hypothetical protein